MGTIVDAILIKADSTGILQWRIMSGETGDDAWDCVVQTSDGEIRTSRYTNSHSAEGDDGWLAKIQSTGNSQWNRTFGGTGIHSWSCVVQTSDGGYALAGTTNSFGVRKE